MKKIYLSALLFWVTTLAFAQAPEKMSYQAVIRNGSNALVTGTVGMKISIRQSSTSGTVVYSETHTPVANANGLVSVEIGTGADVSGTFSSIDWGNGPYFIQTQTDPLGGTTYTVDGTSQLLSVPYALYAKTAGSAPAYGYIYNTDAQVVALEADVLFSSNGVLTSGVTHASGTSTIVIANAGTYEVSFYVSAVEPNQFSLFQNGAPVSGATYGSGAGTQQNSGSVILTLAAGDVLTLRNHTSSASVTLQTLAGGTQTNVNASLKILYLGN